MNDLRPIGVTRFCQVATYCRDTPLWQGASGMTIGRGGVSAASPPSAAVRSGQQRWALASGEQLTFGRSAGRDVRFGHDPVDDYVSRHAGTLVGLDDGVLVRNTSSTQMILLVGMPGPEYRIAPGAAVATMPHDVARVVVPGRFSSRYNIAIDTRALRSITLTEAAVEIPLQAVRGLTTRGQASTITPRELRMLAALCEPVLTLAGDNAATYKQIAVRTGVAASSVRSCLDYLRARLSDVDGIPGLRAEEDTDLRDGSGYLGALARWAIEAGEVNIETLALLPDRARAAP